MKYGKLGVFGFMIGSIFLLSSCTTTTTTSPSTNSASETEKNEQIAKIIIPYSESKLDGLLGREAFILYFHADWCPTCRVILGKIKDSIHEIKGPILQADYDTEKALKKEYGIVTQTSFVFIKADGTVDKKRINPRLSEIIDFFN